MKMENGKNGTSLGRKLCKYRINRNKIRPLNIRPKDLYWPFPGKFYETIGYTVHGFSFKFKNAPANLKGILNSQDDLINNGDNNNLEKGNNNFINEIFFPAKKTIEEKMAEYKAIPATNFINESYFLYGKSNLIKNTFVTAINKQLSLYGSFSYFSGKTSVSNLELINATDSLKFLVEKKSLKDNLKLQVAYVIGSDVKINHKKIHDFSITKLGKRRKNMLPEPIETVIIRAQQDFDVAGGLSQIQIQISNDTVLNLLKKYKNVAYKITPVRLLFPATVTNDTNFIFVTANNISGVKKGILNYKIYNILAEINTSKTNNWNETKGQSILVNVQFKGHKQINNNSHLCFPFIIRSFSDLTSFDIFLQNDQNKKIEFKDGEKKIRILNFQIDVYLT